MEFALLKLLIAKNMILIQVIVRNVIQDLIFMIINALLKY